MQTKIETLEDVVEYMIETKTNPLCIDAWETDPRGFFDVIWNSKTSTVTDNHIIRVRTSSGGGGGMGAYPASVEVSILVRLK